MHARSLYARRSLGAAVVACAAVAPLARPARAEPPPPELLARLALHAEAFEQIEKRGSFLMSEHVQELDGDGKPSSTKDEVARIETDGKSSREVVVKCEEDGKDTTAKEQERARKEEEEGAKKRKEGKESKEDEGLHMPFLATQQALYTFDQIATDAADPTRIEISFAPKKPDKHTVEGAAWVDTTTGTVISTGVKLSKPPSLVDWVHLTAEFGAKTPLGPALSHVTFEVKGGLLFIRKHLRGELKMSEYTIAP